MNKSEPKDAITADDILSNLISYGKPDRDLAVCKCLMVWSPRGIGNDYFERDECAACGEIPVHVLTSEGDAMTGAEYLALEDA